MQHFTPLSWHAIGKLLRQILTVRQQEIFQWHYKYIMLNSWGSTELKLKFKTFDFSEKDYDVVDIYNLDRLDTLPPPLQY